MMGANDLILNLRKSGFSLALHNDRLQIAPADKLTDELKQTILQSKVAILIELRKSSLAESVRNGGTAWMWEVTLPNRILIVTTTPASTMAEMVEMNPEAIKVEVIE
jgi:hypothetical protein